MTDRYAVIGNPVEHSKSPQIHAEFARQTGQDLVYERILAPVGGFEDSLDRFRDEGGRGVNVTVPFKEDAYLYATRRTQRAGLARAVNTLHFLTDGSVLGDTTDGVGLVRDIVGNLGVALGGRRILLMGAGGAARGVIGPLLEEFPSALAVANRSVDRALTLRETFPGIAAGGYDDLNGQCFDVVINATSSSLNNEIPFLPDTVFASGALAYDMMYGRETAFMRFAREHGAQVVADGLGMLVEQAAESFFIWRGVRPETAPVLAGLRAA
jgi:shikimate dehydrogenase